MKREEVIAKRDEHLRRAEFLMQKAMDEPWDLFAPQRIAAASACAQMAAVYQEISRDEAP